MDIAVLDVEPEKRLRALDAGRRVGQFRRHVAELRRIVPGQPAGGELDGERQAPAHFHDRGHHGVVVCPAAARDLLCVPALHGRRVDGGCGEVVTAL